MPISCQTVNSCITHSLWMLIPIKFKSRSRTEFPGLIRVLIQVINSCSERLTTWKLARQSCRVARQVDFTVCHMSYCSISVYSACLPPFHPSTILPRSIWVLPTTAAARCLDTGPCPMESNLSQNSSTLITKPVLASATGVT